MPETIAINQQRLKHLVRLFGLSEGAFLSKISEGLKNKLTKDHIFQETVQISHLKRVDRLFKKGLAFYTDPAPVAQSASASIFFRKDNFNSPLSIGDRKIVSKVEDDISSLMGLAQLSGVEDFTKRKLGTYSMRDNPAAVAGKMRAALYPDGTFSSDRDFLKALIDKFADCNILVHEFVEQWNLKSKSQLNGFFISPNHIVIKRNQGALKREIFTLAHELGHYALNKEEIDQITFGKHARLNSIEKWCNEFAFHFLVNEGCQQELHACASKRLTYDNATVTRISQQNHVSRLAIFTYLAYSSRMSWQHYNQIKEDIDAEYKQKQKQKELEKSATAQSGEKPQTGGAPRPIISPLVRQIYVSAYLEGAASEYQVLKNCATDRKTSIEKIIYG